MTTCSVNSASVDVSTSCLFNSMSTQSLPLFPKFPQVYKMTGGSRLAFLVWGGMGSAGHGLSSFLASSAHASCDLSAVDQRGQAGPLRPHSTAACRAAPGPWGSWHAGTVAIPLSCPPLSHCSPWIAGALPKTQMLLPSATRPLTSRTPPSATSGEKAGCIISRSSPRRGR